VNLRRRLTLVTLAMGAVLAQTVLFPNLKAGGVIPDIVLVSVLVVALQGGPEAGAIYGFGSGMFIDMFLRPPAGLSAMAYTIVGLAMGLIRDRLIRHPWWHYPAIGAVGSLASSTLYLTLGGLAGQEHLWASRSLRIVLVRAIYDGALATIVIPVTTRLLARVPHVPSSRR
jgi:rod shape-determining protein MreD